MGTVIEKNLAAEQDLLLGTGDVVQSRANVNVTVKALDLIRRITSYTVFTESTSASEYIDPAQYKAALVFTDTAASDGIYFWDPSLAVGGADGITKFTSGILTASGLWIRVQQLESNTDYMSYN